MNQPLSKLALLSSLALLPALALADGNADLDRVFTAPNPKLTAQEKAGLAISKNWEASNDKNLLPVAGQSGVVRFTFGAVQPSIVCAVMQVCDVQLQPGEQVNAVNLGDSVRWLVEPAVSGTDDNTIEHLVIKPLDVGLETSLIVTTNRRTYHMRLRSHRTDYMAQVAFDYPEETAAKWAALKKAQQVERKKNTIPATNEYLGDLDFHYTVTGQASWRPVRVYNDGTKTIIEMPDTMRQTEAPTLMVVRKSGSMFKKDENVMVNYRLQGNRYIVDDVFEKAIMIAGVGFGQTKITVERAK
jgi:type IV secretion system protein TrbG